MDEHETTPLRLTVAESPGKGDMLELLDNLRKGVECGEVLGLMVTVISGDMKFDNFSCCDRIPATQRIGYLMCHVTDLVESVRQ